MLIFTNFSDLNLTFFTIEISFLQCKFVKHKSTNIRKINPFSTYFYTRLSIFDEKFNSLLNYAFGLCEFHDLHKRVKTMEYHWLKTSSCLPLNDRLTSQTPWLIFDSQTKTSLLRNNIRKFHSKMRFLNLRRVSWYFFCKVK